MSSRFVSGHNFAPTIIAHHCVTVATC